jgi:hypothetical protein
MTTEDRDKFEAFFLAEHAGRHHARVSARDLGRRVLSAREPARAAIDRRVWYAIAMKRSAVQRGEKYKLLRRRALDGRSDRKQGGTRSWEI